MARFIRICSSVISLVLVCSWGVQASAGSNTFTFTGELLYEDGTPVDDVLMMWAGVFAADSGG